MLVSSLKMCLQPLFEDSNVGIQSNPILLFGRRLDDFTSECEHFRQWPFSLYLDGPINTFSWL